MSQSLPGGRKAFVPQDRSRIADLWFERFGIPNEVFSDISFFLRAASVWAFCNSDLPRLSYEAVGLRAMSFKENPWRPTTYALQVFGKYAAKNIVHLNAGQVGLFLAGGSQVIDASAKPGYVVVSYAGDILGCGLYSKGRLASQLPKECRIPVGIEIET